MSAPSPRQGAVDALSKDDFEGLCRAVEARRRREEVGAGTLAEAAALWRPEPTCPACGSPSAPSELAPNGTPRRRCTSCGLRFGALAGTVLEGAKLDFTDVVGFVIKSIHISPLRLPYRRRSRHRGLVARALYPRACDAIKAAGEARAADLLEGAREDAQQYLLLPPGHWQRVRTNNVQERANREIKRRYRSVQSFPSRASLLRLVGAAVLGEDDAWQQQRVFSEESTARAWEPPAQAPADGSLARGIAEAEATADSIVRSIVDQYGAKQ